MFSSRHMDDPRAVAGFGFAGILALLAGVSAVGLYHDYANGRDLRREVTRFQEQAALVTGLQSLAVKQISLLRAPYPPDPLAAALAEHRSQYLRIRMHILSTEPSPAQKRLLQAEAVITDRVHDAQAQLLEQSAGLDSRPAPLRNLGLVERARLDRLEALLALTRSETDAAITRHTGYSRNRAFELTALAGVALVLGGMIGFGFTRRIGRLTSMLHSRQWIDAPRKSATETEPSDLPEPTTSGGIPTDTHHRAREPASECDLALALAAERQQVLEHLDPLTRLPNRRHLEATFNSMRTLARRSGDLKGLVHVRVDSLRTIARSYGECGGQLLHEVTARLQRIAGDAVVARIEDAEFVLLCSKQTPEALAASLHRALAVPFSVEDEAVGLSCRIGVGHFPQHGNDLTQLIENAKDKRKVIGLPLATAPETRQRAAVELTLAHCKPESN